MAAMRTRSTSPQGYISSHHGTLYVPLCGYVNTFGSLDSNLWQSEEYHTTSFKAETAYCRGYSLCFEFVPVLHPWIATPSRSQDALVYCQYCQ